jgi:hypothetical protein
MAARHISGVFLNQFLEPILMSLMTEKLLDY